jgi:hypothetical protein
VIYTHQVSKAKNNNGLQWLSTSKCVLIGVGNLSTKALSDTKCKLYGIDAVKLLKEAGFGFIAPRSIILDEADYNVVDHYVLCALENTDRLHLTDFEVMVS